MTASGFRVFNPAYSRLVHKCKIRFCLCVVRFVYMHTSLSSTLKKDSASYTHVVFLNLRE